MKLNDRGSYGFSLQLDEIDVDLSDKAMIDTAMKIFNKSPVQIQDSFNKNIATRVLLEFRLVVVVWLLMRDEIGMGKKKCQKYLKRIDLVQDRYTEIEKIINDVSKELIALNEARKIPPQ